MWKPLHISMVPISMRGCNVGTTADIFGTNIHVRVQCRNQCRSLSKLSQHKARVVAMSTMAARGDSEIRVCQETVRFVSVRRQRGASEIRVCQETVRFVYVTLSGDSEIRVCQETVRFVSVRRQ
ncbi:hypothetical protein RRG08_046970 [Elysia crispata]|uniref:Uncharacterized protein n=1 Tax=Elysia crispata TaxID=231223 RepID=A0AAE1A9Y9_9GAST|nr:hypothetical protein RRG08_046970 [Elysia crispata]